MSEYNKPIDRDYFKRKENPKWKTNLFEHYYEKTMSDQELLDIRDLMINSVDGFFASDSYRFIQTMSDTQWLAIEDLDSFEIHGAKLWVKLDFAIRHGDRVYIYDWKTGKVAKENEVQLECILDGQSQQAHHEFGGNIWLVDGFF